MIFYCAYYQQVSSSLNSTAYRQLEEPWDVGKVGQRNQDNQCLGMHCCRRVRLWDAPADGRLPLTPCQ